MLSKIRSLKRYSNINKKKMVMGVTIGSSVTYAYYQYTHNVKHDLQEPNDITCYITDDDDTDARIARIIAQIEEDNQLNLSQNETVERSRSEFETSQVETIKQSPLDFEIFLEKYRRR